METEVIALIQTVGFPITMTISLMWFIRGQMLDFRKAIENNTLATNSLLSKLDIIFSTLKANPTNNLERY